MRKKLIAFVMAVMVTFTVTGCQNSKDEEIVTYKGRYVEEEVSLPGQYGLFGELFLHDETASFLDYGTKEICQLNDDKSEFSKSALSDTSSLGTDLYIPCAVCSPDGTYFFSYYNSSGGNEMQYAAITVDGEVSSFSLDGIYLYMLEFSPDGRLFAFGYGKSDYHQVYEIDIQRQSAKALFSINDEACAFDVVNDYIVAVDSSEMYFYDYKNNTLTDTPEAMQDFLSEQSLTGNTQHVAYDFCSGEDGSFYIVSKKGLYRYVMGGNMVEQLIDGYACRLGNPSYNVSSVICDADGSFLISYEEGVLMRYRYDPEAVNEITSTLKIYSLTENDTLSQIISEYKMKNPTVQVDYEVGIRRGITYDDALKNLTTEVLSDNAPDVMMLDGLDIDNYIEKNMLLDLTDSEVLWNPDNVLLDNVAKWNSNDSGLYSVACKFEVPIIIAWQEDMERIGSLSDFADVIEEKYDGDLYNPEGYVTYFLSAGDIIDTAFALVGDNAVTENGIDKNAMIQMLRDCAKIYQEGDDRYVESKVALEYEESRAPNERWGIRPAGRSLYILDGAAVIASGTTRGFDTDLNLITSLNTENSDIAYRYGLNDESNTFIPKCNLGICTAGDNIDEAQHFIAAAISENVQNVENYDGFPVNKNSLQKFYDKNQDKDYYKAMGTSLTTVHAKWMNDKEVAEFQSTIEKLSEPVILDTMTHDIIIDVGTKCLEGSLTPEEAADEIARQLDLRMKE